MASPLEPLLVVVIRDDGDGALLGYEAVLAGMRHSRSDDETDQALRDRAVRETLPANRVIVLQELRERGRLQPRSEKASCAHVTEIRGR